MNIKYVSPSYKRPYTCSILRYLSKVEVYVSPEEYKEYLKCNKGHEKQIKKVPAGVQGKGKGHCLNWVLDNVWTDDLDAMIILDDDMECLMAHELNKKNSIVSEAEFYYLCEKYSLLAKEWGCGLWTVNLNSDPITYDCFKPFRLHAYCDGQFTAIVKNPSDIRYDEQLTVKEDVDFCLQHMEKYHKALRIDKYYPKAKSFDNKGGCYDLRSEETEKEQFKLMQQKWGSQIVRPNRPKAKSSSKIRSLGGAIKINLPLKGV